MFVKSINFTTYSSIRIGQPVDVTVIERDDPIPHDRTIIGGANNLLISPAPPPLMILGKDFAYIQQSDDLIEIGAAMLSGRIVSYAKKHDLGGFEFMGKLPGTLGGMLAMNAGLKEYEIFDDLHSVQIGGKWLSKSDIEHGYRFAHLGDVATAARFAIRHGYDHDLEKQLKALRSNQPHDPSAGSAFKNPPEDSAGRLIDAAGLRGRQIGGMAWSPIHANFLVNLGGGTYEDAITLIALAKHEVEKRFGIVLEEEIRIL